MAKDFTRYSFDGKTNLPKNRLVLEVIKKYVQDHPDATFDQVRKIFPRSINGSIEIVELLEKIQEKKSKRVLFFVGKDEPIQLANGEIIVVTTEWGNNNSNGIPNIQDFIKKSEELGYEISFVNNDVSSRTRYVPAVEEINYYEMEQDPSKLHSADRYLFALIKVFSEKDGDSENQKDMLKFHVSQENYSTTARIISEKLGLSNIGHANLLYGKLSKKLCQILKRKYRRYIQILFNLIKSDDFNNELQWILHPPVVEALNRFFSMSEEEKTEFVENSEENEPVKKMKGSNQPLNLILYGPPGTGKTYNTTAFAARLIEGGDPFEIMTNLENNELSDIEVKRFAELRKSGQIEFITFHQSYSYEDFVEGIKPDVEKEEMKFKRVDGIFKNICVKAKENYEISQKSPDEINESLSFLKALETVKELVINADKTNPIKINDTAYFLFAEDDAFRYSADNWTLNGKGFDGFRMKYSDLIEFYKNDIQERSEIKNLSNISGLAKQHASYFFKAYEIVKNHMKNIKEIKNSVKKQNFVLIIDEINRGNISRIFGELITLIEEDKRDGKLTVKLPYSQEDFTVPSNLFIIGTMNTADRSIALLDIALRRRFTFFRFDPRPELVENTKAKEIMIKLNEKIKEYKGTDFQIGHSYFMKVTNDEELETVLKYKINPLLEEYFVNDSKRLEELKSLMDKKS